jgi:hypothetical protein
VPSVPGFLPSTNGLRFVNAWPDEPVVVVSVPGFGDVKIGNASNGLCGGMVFLVRDVFEAHLPPIQDPQPARGTPLFDYIVQRLIASYHIPDGVLRYFAWMNTPDADSGFWFLTRRGIAWKTVVEQWPSIRADIDVGHPSPLGIVTVRSTNPGDLGRNHQILAYGYELDAAQNLIIHVYDPNTDSANGDGVFLALNVKDPTRATPITHNVAIGDPIRGFFRIPYSFRDPGLLGRR